MDDRADLRTILVRALEQYLDDDRPKPPARNERQG
jgi:hypothetical protein